MKLILVGWTICLSFASGTVLAAQGPAGTVGPCSQIVGPIGPDGHPLGFTCADVGGNALLIWNASSIGGNISVNGTFKTLNLHVGALSIDGSFTSSGPVGFVGGSISVIGRIKAPDVLIVGATSTENEVKGTLLGASGRVQSRSTGPVSIEAGATVTATTGNLVVAGSSILNDGKLNAPHGTASLTTGSELDIGWTDTAWTAGEHNPNRIGENRAVNNTGTITAQNVILEAHRSTVDVISITNGGTVTGTETITFITGRAGRALPSGEYERRSFGIDNGAGKIFSPKVTITQYYKAQPGGQPELRDFQTEDDTDLFWLNHAVGGTSASTTNNTPGSSTSVVNTSTAPGSAPLTTANLVIPQLAVSVTHMNSTSAVRAPIAVASSSSDVVRGVAPSAATAANKKPRVKAKPVLVRGSFFNSKISGKITASR